MTTAPRNQAPGSARASVGDYTLLSKIGEGGMGVVHLARRPGGERVALKVLRPHIVGDDEARSRLAREVNSLSRIRSRWVSEIVDADPWAPVPYVATRYVPGLSLHDHVLEEGPIEGDDLTWFAACLAEGVASVHAVGVLHRDVKPSNVLMEGRTPILIDFGLARVADDPRLTHTGWLLGTPGYLAPEILYGEDATAASDVHSWAATVAYAAMGRPPFGRGPSMAIMDRVRRGEHDLSDAPENLRPLLAAALDPAPDRRPTLDELLARLRPGTTGPGDATPEHEDPYTLPLAFVHQSAAGATTDVLAGGGAGTGPAPTRVFEEETTRAQREWSPDQPVPDEVPAPARAPWTERLRRGLLLLAGAAVVGAALAAYPWPAAAAVVVGVWLLRSGSLAASAAGDRRRLRGRRWYDGPQLLVRAPWDLLRSIPGTLMLVLWAGGLAAAGALICYAVAASEAVTLAVSGAVLAGALWTGPGGSRLRSPLARVVHPAARTWQTWLGAFVLLLALAAALAFLVQRTGVSWLPGDERPLAGHSLGQTPR